MDSQEIITYLYDNKMQWKILEVLIFNNNGFSFIPILGPQLSVLEKQNSVSVSLAILDKNDVNLLNSPYQRPSILVPEEVIKERGWNKMINHPEHLAAYLCRYENDVFGEVFYSRSVVEGRRRVREGAFAYFLDILNIDSIEKLDEIVHDALLRRQSYVRKTVSVKYEEMYSTDLLFDDETIDYGSRIEVPDSKLKILISKSLCENQARIIEDKLISVNHECIIRGEYGLNSVFFKASFVGVKDVYTNIASDIAVIDSRDEISNILYKIAVDIGATTFRAATGYAFKSGLQMLQPVLHFIKEINDINENAGNVELILGDLGNFIKKRKSSINRAAAKELNDYLSSGLIGKLYAYAPSFYHGKYYYISNGEESYVIMGSSNITESAYSKNQELDVIYHFKNNEDELLLSFEKRFEDIKQESVIIDALVEEEYPSNTDYDERGQSHGRSIIKKLEEDEAKRRISFLNDFSPGDIYDRFKKDVKYKYFKEYIAFSYPQYHISILESTKYGDACYAFRTDDIEEIKRIIAFRFREVVKDLDICIASVNHDDSFYTTMSELFEQYKNI